MQASSSEPPSQLIRIHGHLLSKRCLGKIAFFNLRHANGVIQVVCEDVEMIRVIEGLTLESCLKVEGHLRPINKTDSFELALHKLEIVTPSSINPPVELAKKSQMDNLSLTKMFDYRPLTLRSPQVRAIFSLQALIAQAFEQFLVEEGFTRIFSPKIVASGTEGGANLFALDYFSTRAFLAQSPQFYKQIMVGVFERVFEIGPVFRAEPHSTARHLNEYISLDVEMGFIESADVLMDLETRMLAYIFQAVKESPLAVLLELEIPDLANIPKIDYQESIQLLASKFSYEPACTDESVGPELDPQAERLLAEHFKASENSDFLFITGFPLALRPFYTLENVSSRAKLRSSHGFDLLFRGLEITTGGLRIHQYEQLVKSMEERGLNSIDYADYLQCFAYAMPPHGGFAIGLERLTAQLAALPSVKLASLFPRDINRLSP